MVSEIRHFGIYRRGRYPPITNSAEPENGLLDFRKRISKILLRSKVRARTDGQTDRRTDRQNGHSYKAASVVLPLLNNYPNANKGSVLLLLLLLLGNPVLALLTQTLKH